MIYSVYRRGFIITIMVRLILCISLIVPTMCPTSLLPAPFKKIMKDFIVLFHIGIPNPSTIYPYLKMKFYSAVRNNEKWFECKWMQLEDIMSSEVNQAQKNKGYMLPLIHGT
jgi:hypothetical protein